MRRADDEFLRRMMGGKSVPTSDGFHRGQMPASMPHTEQVAMPADCNTPINPAMPSLAMVYAPKQAWRCSYTPTQALSRGTLFYELDKPFEVTSRGSGGCKLC